MVMVCIVLVGMVLSYIPSPYGYDVEFEQDGSTVNYRFDSNTDMETTAVLISNTGEHRIDRIIVYFDEEFSSLNPWGLQEEMFDELSIQLEHRGMPALELCDSETLVEMMSVCDPSGTAVLVASGAISNIVYDGTSDCPLIEWLNSGGTLVNIGGCLGKYVSLGPDDSEMMEVERYGDLFAGVPDGSFMDSRYEVRGNYGNNFRRHNMQ